MKYFSSNPNVLGSDSRRSVYNCYLVSFCAKPYSTISVLVSVVILLLCTFVLNAQTLPYKWQYLRKTVINGANLDTAGQPTVNIVGKLGNKYVALTTLNSLYDDTTVRDVRDIILTSTNGYEWTSAPNGSEFKPSTFWQHRCGMVTFSETEAIAVYNFILYRTTDGGDSWKPFYPNGQRFYTISIEPTGYGNAIMLPSYARDTELWYSDDRGQTWRDIRPEQVKGEETFLHATPIGSEDNLYLTRYINLLGVDSTAVKFFKSTDKGLTWRDLGCTISGFENLYDKIFFSSYPKFVSQTLGYCSFNTKLDSGYYGYICRTTNAGESWDIMYSQRNNIDGFNALTIIGAFGDTVIVSNGVYNILRSNNGGEKWEYLVNKSPTEPGSGNIVYYPGARSFLPRMVSPDEGYLLLRLQRYQWGEGGFTVATFGKNPTTSVDNVINNSSNTAYVWFAGANPQPCNDIVQINAYFETSKAHRFEAAIYDIMGFKHNDFSKDLESLRPEGWFSFPVQTGGLSTGMYYIVLGNGSERRSMPLCVVR